MSTYQPYFYIIYWPQLEWYYAGIEVAKTVKLANPSNLFRKGDGTRYTTSSKLVNRFARWFGDPQVIEVVSFATAEEASSFEAEFLRLADIKNNTETWLNRHVSGEGWLCVGHSKETREKMSAAAIKRGGRKQAEATRRKLSESRKGVPSPRKGKTLPESHRKNLSIAAQKREAAKRAKNREA